MLDINSHELKGSKDPATLSYALCAGGFGNGWNNGGSYAFGPFQFMLDSKPACYNHSLWGTFGAYDFAAFRAAKTKGVSIPYRFKNPASNLGQSIVAAYMLANGLSYHWGR